jgi:O-methyltransferase domain
MISSPVMVSRSVSNFMLAISSATSCRKPMSSVLSHILHDWDLAEKRLLLDWAYEALPKGGALIVYDAIIDDERRHNAFGLLMSLNMLIETKGGFDYTGAECRGWMREAGFSKTRVEHLVGPDSMVIGIK